MAGFKRPFREWPSKLLAHWPFVTVNRPLAVHARLLKPTWEFTSRLGMNPSGVLAPRLLDVDHGRGCCIGVGPTGRIELIGRERHELGWSRQVPLGGSMGGVLIV